MSCPVVRSLTPRPRVKSLVTVVCALVLATFAAAAPKLAWDQPLGVYAAGAEAVLTIERDDVGEGAAALTVKILRDNREEVLAETMPAAEVARTLRFTPSRAGWYVASVSKPGEKKPAAMTGAVFDTAGFAASLPAPDDFAAFWSAQKARLVASPAEAKLESLSAGQREFETANPDHLKNILNWENQGATAVNLEIDCPGAQPLRAYFATPPKPRQGGHPAILYFRAAGVASGWCRSSLVNAMGFSARYDALVVDLNAHGMLNGQPQAYYDALEKGELAGYQNRGKESRDTFYFLGMFLRLQRAIDYLAARPEWDGRNIVCIGISQGGAQALAAAGLDPRVNIVVATVPGMCDIAGRSIGSPGGWPQLSDGEADAARLAREVGTVRYFDAINFTTRSRAATLLTVGLVDTTCPPPGIFAAYNTLKTEKRIEVVADKGHHALSVWNAGQRAAQESFIRANLR